MTDRVTVRSVVIGLILLALGVVAAMVYALGVVDLAAEQRGTIIGVLASMGTGALGALAGILAHTASNDPGGTTTTTTSAPPSEPPTITPTPVEPGV